MRRWVMLGIVVVASAMLAACGGVQLSGSGTEGAIETESAQEVAAVSEGSAESSAELPQEAKALELDAKATLGPVSFDYPASWGEPYQTEEHLLVGDRALEDDPSIIAMVSSEFPNKPPVAPLGQADSYYMTLADLVNQTTGKEPYITVTMADPWVVERGEGYVKLMASYVSRTGGSGAEWYGIKALVFTPQDVYLFDAQTFPDDLSTCLHTMEAMANSVTVSISADAKANANVSASADADVNANK